MWLNILHAQSYIFYLTQKGFSILFAKQIRKLQSPTQNVAQALGILPKQCGGAQDHQLQEAKRKGKATLNIVEKALGREILRNFAT